MESRSKRFRTGDLLTSLIVITGLVPVIPLILARPCKSKRDGRDKPDKPGHDEEGNFSRTTLR
jgi:hypothetical protein